jgi:hypothetical protein
LLYATPEELPAAEIEQRIADFFAQETIWRERERKGERYTYNLRPLVLELYLTPTLSRGEGRGEVQSIFLRVQQRPGATGRPDEVVAALGLDDFPRTLQRDRLYFAANPEDAELFARYPVIHQNAIAGPKPPPLPRPAKPEVRERGRSIGERAGDEFV